MLGGVIAEKLHWSLIFWINLPLAALAVFMTERTLAKLPWTKRDHTLDWLGAFLIVSATVSLMLALTFGGKGEGWTSPPVVALFVAAVVLAGLFAWQLTRAAEPLIPIAVLQNPVVKLGTLSVFFAMAAFVGMSIYVPLYLELVLGLSASNAGFALVGYMVGTVFGVKPGDEIT